MQSYSNITTFIEVAKCRSFAAAASRLGLSTSATSKAVARLEEDLGVKLLHRTTRSVGLTPEGTRFLEGASRVLDDMDSLVREVTDTREVPKGRLVVGSTVVFGRLWLMDCAVQFRRLYPDVEIELVLDDRASDLAADGLDIVVRAGDLEDNANLVARKFFEDQTVLCASPDYLARAGVPMTVEDLDNHCCLQFRNPAHGRLYPYRFTLKGHSISKVMGGGLIANEGEAIKNAAVAGAGVAQLPSYMVIDDLEAGRLVPLMRRLWPIPQPYHILYLDRRLVSKRIRVFIDFMLKNRPDWAANLPSILARS